MNDQRKVSLDYIMARYMVKYTRLNQLIGTAFSNSNARSINLFIDLYGLYKTIFSRSYRTETNNYKAFISCLVNICGHYRQYFKNIRVYPRIFIISSFNTLEQTTKSIAGYNKTMMDKLMNKEVLDMVTINTELLNIITPYLPQIYYFHTNYESSALMNYIIQNYSNSNLNIIISSDLYPIQLCAYNSNTAFIRPLKSNGQDNSMIVCTNDNPIFRQSFWGLLADIDTLSKSLSYTNLSPLNSGLLFALSRYPLRDLKSLVSTNEAIKYIDSIIQGEDIILNTDTLYRSIPDLVNKIPPSVLESRFKALDLNYQTLLYTNSMEKDLLEFKDLVDPESLSMINSKYFSEEPLDLYRL